LFSDELTTQNTVANRVIGVRGHDEGVPPCLSKWDNEGGGAFS